MTTQFDADLRDAIENLDSSKAEEALRKGADPNSLHFGIRPLHHAVDSEADAYNQSGVSDRPGQPPSGLLVRLLLEAGADPNLTSDRGQTPLDWAANGYHPAAYELLVRYGGRNSGVGPLIPPHP